jgi:hypothetical protein
MFQMLGVFAEFERTPLRRLRPQPTHPNVR